MRADAAPSTQALRGWQRKALVKYLTAKPRDYLAVATPGAGKTTFALRIAAELLNDRTVDAITVVVPTEHLKIQWAESAARNGIALDPRFSNSDSQTSAEYHGVVVTYAQVASHPTRHRVRTENRKTLVIFDEIHHGGDAKSWGDAMREAFDDATRRLSLTGTPFRSDDSPIPFVNYEPDEAGFQRSQADHVYGYSDALADGVVRPVVFLAYSGEARWRDSAGEEHAARLGEPLTAEHTARAWRTALNPTGEWMPAVIAAADKRLQQKRQHVPDAGGMIIATNQTTARAYADLLTKITGEVPTVVLSDDPSASDRISQYSASTSRWLVAVRMVSEGVDVPRLSVGVYATSASTPLFFAQAIGRFVRSRRAGETASIFLPSVPNLLLLASELEAQRNHVLGKPHRESDGLDDEALEAAEKRKDEKGELENGFESLGADAELDQVIFDGASFGTATPAGSDEEADYLGIPGLLDATQMRDLLRRRQDEQLTKRTAEAAVSGGPPPSRTTHGQIRELRRELNALVTIAHHRTGKPHGWIHNELRRICGGPPVAAATTDHLKARIEAVRDLKA
ncbi:MULTISPECIES: DEAD/DEAH box helicase [unclassified Mycolicibacterium]|uniref:DEAD/DEAH box helicase n=3 Tax=Mycolicibacterium TaxID=1866885 RepID=UPI00130C4212|nr:MULTISPECIES: DEAD/DEAH box helicase [unclassified Mycolicibacterium]MUL81807.1 DEAD/DEAH box helicase [Mycolicibacterium sp. CBMA 329]MUL87573.1 DEAD/DEAH box helicase [Mycolicibacterium sp. CBMA 331]MUL99563.1 DEAD/DEAH box helicase [Mycolicibacterium sp. CBMA 334]MUM37870.1 DEAD/DEAH box helicase [Mycolicibacterium sp. CBMA 247]MUM43638.1 DEAD/DEAH box helicase [Mycolicibacterium sp. CBMA 294]